MLISRKELEYRLDTLEMIGVSKVHQQYLIDSVNNEQYEYFIKLVDELSSSVFMMAVEPGNPIHTENHLEKRKKLIDSYVGLSNHLLIQEETKCLE